jgi:hypothetical protein
MDSIEREEIGKNKRVKRKFAALTNNKDPFSGGKRRAKKYQAKLGISRKELLKYLKVYRFYHSD